MDLFNRVLYYLSLLGAPFYDMWRSALAIRNAMWSVFGAIGFKFIHIYRVHIPNVVNNLSLLLVSYINRRVAETAAFLDARITLWARLTEKWIAEDRARMNAIVRWAEQQIALVWGTLRPTAQLVAALLTSPERMADWLVAAMLRRVLAYIAENGERILLWLLRSSPRAVLNLALELEKLIVRVL